jgi:Pro-kumamolisin, activation domain
MHMTKQLLVLFALVFLVCESGEAAGCADTSAPDLNRFVLYAERGLALGPRCTVEYGDMGVRTPGRLPDSLGQLIIGEHSRCEQVFSPSVTIDHGAEGRTIATIILTDHSDRWPDRSVAFPAATMPALPLAWAAGSGSAVSIPHCKKRTLVPGTYGALVLGRHSRLELSAGNYVFARVILGRHARLMASGVVNISIVGRLSMEEGSKLAVADMGKAGDLTVSIMGSITGDTAAAYQPVAYIGRHATVHALLAAPHGRIMIGDGARVRGAVAAFDIITGGYVRIRWESGFPATTAAQQGTQQLAGYFSAGGDPRVAPVMGVVPADSSIRLEIGLPIRNLAGLTSFLGQVSDPKNASFRQYLTQTQFTSSNGATASDYQQLTNWASVSHGLTIVRTYPNNLLLSIKGTAAQLGHALYANLVYRRRNDGTLFVAADREPSLDLTVPLLHISGLTDFYLPYALVNLNGTGTGNSYRSADIRSAYLGVGTSCSSLDGRGQVVGIVDFASFDSNDIRGYDSMQANLPTLPSTANVSIVSTEGGSPAANSSGEATLDVEMVQAMAPAARILFFQGNSGLTGHLDDIFHLMATSSPALTVGSCSLFFGRSDNVVQALKQMAAQGVSFFTASGDFGDVGDPQNNADMDFQTLVGGTFLSTNNLTGPPSNYPNPYYQSDSTWIEHMPSQQSGITSGGIMNGNNQGGGNIFNSPATGCQCWPQGLCCGSGVAIPGYQVGVDMRTNGGSQSWRNYPDVAMLAANAEIFFQGQPNGGFWGTSFAAPLWAGYTALVNQQSQLNNAGLVGFLNPTLYDIGLTRGSTTDLYKLCFNDDSDGRSNFNQFGSGFNAVPGYDLCTGWGTPTCQLLNQLSTIAPLTPNEPLTEIEITIGTGGDDLGNSGKSDSATAVVTLTNGSSFTVQLSHETDPTWGNGSVHTLDFLIPASVTLPTPSSGVASMSITLGQPPCTTFCDNWDISSVCVTLFNPGSAKLCQISQGPTTRLQDGSMGVARLSKRAGSGGSGPTATIPVTPGCSACP